MAHAKGLPKFFERGIRMFLDVTPEFFRIQFSPMSPTDFGGQRTRFLGGQIAVHAAAADVKPPGGLTFCAAFLDELYHTFAQIKAVCFHAQQSTTLCANVNRKCYSSRAGNQGVRNR
jgi:hypothetical protein